MIGAVSLEYDPFVSKNQSIARETTSCSGHLPVGNGIIRLKSGCMDCAVYTDQGEGQTILYLEKWQSGEHLDRHIRSELYFRVLSAMELAGEPPKIYFHEVSDTKGLEYVEALRTALPGMRAREQLLERHLVAWRAA